MINFALQPWQVSHGLVGHHPMRHHLMGHRSSRIRCRAAVWLAGLVVFGMAVIDASTPASAQSSDDAARIAEMQTRIDQLEEQLVDMQVVIGTLETIARQGVSAPSRPAYNNSGGGNGNVEARLSSLETQIQALASQLGAGGGAPVYQNQGFQAPTYGSEQPPYQDNSFVQPGFDTGAAGSGQDGIGQFITETDQGGAAAPRVARSSAGTPDQLYKEASSYLLQQDYGAAESSFKEFLTLYPKDRLASNAQYWIGESHYMRGQYREAADAFLQGFKRDRAGEKAPDSLLKLAMSLTRLGQNDAACATFAEMDNAFPAADAKIKRRSQSERQRAGC